MTLYSNVLFVHILSALTLFLGYGLEWTVSALLRHSSTTDQARAWLRVYRVSPPVTGVSLAVLILSGGWLASLTGGMYHAWLVVSVAGIVVALLIGFALILPRLKAIRAALPEGNLPLTPEALLQLQSAVLPTMIRVRVWLAAGIVYLMTVKPSLGASLIALVTSMVLGVLSSVPSWSHGSAKTATA